MGQLIGKYIQYFRYLLYEANLAFRLHCKLSACISNCRQCNEVSLRQTLVNVYAPSV